MVEARGRSYGGIKAGIEWGIKDADKVNWVY